MPYSISPTRQESAVSLHLGLYYGFDWAAMVLTLLAIYMLGDKQRLGFVVMMAGNVSWVVVGILAESLAMILANLVFGAMNVRGLIKWSRET
jgi:hypothetical protein